MWRLGLRRNHHLCVSHLRAKRFFITLLEARPKSASRECALGSMTNIARTPTYPREATRETSFHGLAPPHFSGAFELFGHASSVARHKFVD